MFGNLLDKAMNTPGFVFYAMTFGLIYHYWQSATANAYRAGWGRLIPDSVVKFVSSEIAAKTQRAMRKQEEQGNQPENTKNGTS